MRDRPFIQANESPRPYSELRGERQAFDPTEAVMRQIVELEAGAREADDPGQAKRLQCEAEDLRCSLHDLAARRFQ
jgi:hypothetical protein